MVPTKRLSAAEARLKAEECKSLAMRVGLVEHRVMLEHMAETWERIANDIETKRPR